MPGGHAVPLRADASRADRVDSGLWRASIALLLSREFLGMILGPVGITGSRPGQYPRLAEPDASRGHIARQVNAPGSGVIGVGRPKNPRTPLASGGWLCG